MADLKRRKLGDNRNQSGNRPPQNTNQAQGQNPPAGQAAGGQPGQNPTQNQNRQPQRSQNQGQNRNQPQRQNSNNRGSGQGNSQGQQNRNQGNNRNQNQRQPARQMPRPPPPPPAFFQRDLLLVISKAGSEGIEKIRERLDPLAKKIPAHITLVFPEPAKAIPPEFLKSMAALELPSLQSLTFSHVHIHDDMYLWLLPDDEGKQKLLAWREALVNTLTEKTPDHTQGSEEFSPHLTLGYIPRSLTPEDCLTFAKEFVTTPLTVTFEKLLLEEFSENQISTAVDIIPLTLSP